MTARGPVELITTGSAMIAEPGSAKIAEPGSAMIVGPASYLAVPPSTRLNNPFVTGLLFENSQPGIRELLGKSHIFVKIAHFLCDFHQNVRFS